MSEAQGRTALTNALTVDVEDYFQVSALAPQIDRSTWEGRECRVERNVDRLLSLFSDRGAHATFFALGWIAERYPHLVRQIVAAGHEIASHGYGHLRCTDQSRADFRDDVRRAKGLLEDLAGQRVLGYRAPSFSIGAGNQWAFDVLLEAGYRYSSSVYPVRHDHYALRLRRAPGPARDSDHDDAPARSQPPCRRWRLLSACPVPAQPLGAAPCQHDRSAPGDLLPAPMGDRPRSAADTGHEPEDPVSSLRQPAQDRITPRPFAARLSLGPSRQGLRAATRVNLADLHPASAAALAVRRFRDADRERWDAFIFACPGALSLTPINAPVSRVA